MSRMVTPTVREIPRERTIVERDTFADERDSNRRPRERYNRAAQREMIRRSLDFETTRDVYRNRKD